MASKATDAQLPSTVICELCSESYNDPRLLPCLHSFCKECLEKEAEKVGSQQNLKCPNTNCNKSFPFPKEGISGFPRNLRLIFNVEIAGYQARMESSSDVACDNCMDSSSGPAVAFCIECCEFLCKSCRDFHRRSRKTLKHKFVSMGEKKTRDFTKDMKPKEFCCTKPKHENEILKFFCETCQQLVCRDCVLVEHKEHKHLELSSTAKSFRQNLKSLLDPAHEAIATLESAMSSSDKMKQQVQSRAKTVDAAIEEVYDNLKKALEARKAILLAKSKEIAVAKVTALTVQKEVFQFLQQETKSYVEFTTDVLQTYTDEEVVALAGLLHSELEAVLNRFRNVSLQLNESDAMPISLEAKPLLEEIGQFGEVTGGCSPAHSVVQLHIPQAIKGRERKFQVIARKENGEPFEYGGEDVRGKLRLMGSTEAPVNGKTVDNGDGTYEMSLTPQSTGEHELSITIRNQPIKGSPFTVSVHKPRDYTSLPSSPPQNLYYIVKLSNLGGNVYSVAFHENGDLYVGLSNNVIRIINPTDGSTKATIGSGGSGKCEFSSPEALAIRGDALYVADMSNNRVQKISATGTHDFISEFGKKGSYSGQFNSPQGLCLDLEGRIFVADCNNNRVQVFEGDGTFAYTIPKDGSQKGSDIQGPWGLAFDPTGNLHVVSRSANIVKVFTPDGTFITEYGKGHLAVPAGIAIDAEGYSFVTEYNGTSSRLQIFDPDHQLIKTVTGFNNPQSVTFSKDGFIYVGDRSNNRVVKY